MPQTDEQKKAKPPQRDANGKLIIKYDSRLVSPKKHDAAWRAKKLAQYNKDHDELVRKGKGTTLLGYFSPARSSSTGDNFVETEKQQAKSARGRGPQLRGGLKQSKVVSGTFGKFATNASGDPYMSPSQIRAAYLKKEKAKRIQPGAFAAGKKKSAMLTDTFSRPRYLSQIDGDSDVADLKDKIKKAKATMAQPTAKFEKFKQPNFTTNPIKKGGPGMVGVLMPVYGEPDSKLKRISKYVESPYSAARDAEIAALKASEEKLRAVHGDSAKAFSGMVSKKGVKTFHSDLELYGEDEDAVAMIEAKQKKEQALKEKAKASAKEDDEEPPPAWRPSHPAKNMMYVDKKAMFGGLHTHVPDPVPEFQPGAHLPKKKPEGDGEGNPAWVPNGSHSHGYKGTASVCLNNAQLRHQLFQSNNTRTSRSTARATTR